MNATSGWNAASITTSSEGGQQVRIDVFSGNVSNKNSVQRELNSSAWYQGYNLDGINEFLVSGARFDWQPHTHYS